VSCKKDPYTPGLPNPVPAYESTRRVIIALE
jgi:hypothetical protein